ncbi:hypothetical protein FKM82_020400 [Ascaphus truei]
MEISDMVNKIKGTTITHSRLRWCPQDFNSTLMGSLPLNHAGAIEIANTSHTPFPLPCLQYTSKKKVMTVPDSNQGFNERS